MKLVKLAYEWVGVSVFPTGLFPQDAMAFVKQTVITKRRVLSKPIWANQSAFKNTSQQPRNSTTATCFGSRRIIFQLYTIIHSEKDTELFIIVYSHKMAWCEPKHVAVVVL